MAVTAWTNTVRIPLSWREDMFDDHAQSLYVGAFYVGHITIIQHPTRGVLWRAWLTCDEVEDEVSYHQTEQESKDALVDAALKLLLADT